MIIDFHVHCFNDHIAARAIEKLSRTADIPAYTDGTVADTREKMRLWGIDMAVVHSIATTVSSQPKVNEFALSLLCYNDLIPFGSVHPNAQDAVYEIRRLHDAGIKGIKLHPEYQGFDIDDEKAYPIYETIASLDMVMLFHGGFDAAYPTSLRASAEKCARMLDSFEGAKIVLAHLGGMREWDKIETLIAGRDVYMDLSMLPGYLEPEKAKNIIKLHPSSRLLFGTDCPWCTAPRIIEYMNALDLTKEEHKQIYHENAARILNM